jgi:hypothetical protein
MSIDCCKSYVGKQIIGLLPGGSTQECLYYYAPNVQVYGWTIDGIIVDDQISINNALSSYGYYYQYYLTLDYAESRLSLTYIGNEPPTYIPIILDSNGDPVTWYLTNCCTKVCLKQTYNANQYYYLQTGYGWVAEIGDYISDWDPLNLFMPQLIQGLYGLDATYSAIDNGDGTWDITIDNAYICSPIAWSSDNVTYTEMVDCSATRCLFSSSRILDSAGDFCFTDPGWDFNGQGVDFTAAANVYGGYAVNDGNPGNLPYGADTCSNVTFLYVGYNQPAPIDIVDPIFGPYQAPLGNSYCSYGCLTTNSILLKDTYYGLSALGLIDVPFSSYGTSFIDFVNDMATAEAILGALFSKYYPGSVVNVTSDGADYFTITLNNVYYNPTFLTFALNDSGGIPIISTTLVPC